MQFAYSRAYRKQASCVVLLSNDGDYAYLLSRLRDIEVQVVVMFDGRPALALLQACDSSLSWRYDVLQLPAPDRQATSSASGDTLCSRMDSGIQQRGASRGSRSIITVRRWGISIIVRLARRIRKTFRHRFLPPDRIDREDQNHQTKQNGDPETLWRLTQAGRDMRSRMQASPKLKPQKPDTCAGRKRKRDETPPRLQL